MKFDELKSVAHNVAASISDGVSMLYGAYELNIHGEASSAPEGHIVVDFLTGSASGSPVSSGLRDILRKSPDVVADLCRRHGGEVDEIAEFTARYAVDNVYGPYFTVSVANRAGKRSVITYAGISGRKLRAR